MHDITQEITEQTASFPRAVSTTHHVHHFESFQEFAVSVFEAVGLVYHHTAPRYTTELRTVGQNHLKGCYHRVEPINSLHYLTLGVGAKKGGKRIKWEKSKIVFLGQK